VVGAQHCIVHQVDVSSFPGGFELNYPTKHWLLAAPTADNASVPESLQHIAAPEPPRCGPQHVVNGVISP
jgi:hypothetical protein